MRLLTDIDADEVSPVARGANRRRFLLLKSEGDGMQLDTELADVLAIPAPNEAALVEQLRKEGASESEQRAAVATLRLIEGFPDLAQDVLKARSGDTDDPDDDDGAVTKELATPEGEGQYDYSGHPVGGLVGHGSNDDDLDGDDDGADTTATAAGAPRDGQAGSDDDNQGEASGQSNLNKRTFSADDRKRLAGSGAAMSDGSFPIENKSDLENAIQAIGRAKNPATAKAHIKARAKSLGATNLLPDTWGGGKSNVNKEEHDMSEGTVPVRKEDGSWDLSSLAPEAQEFWADVRKSEDELRDRVEKAETLAAKAEDELRTTEFIRKSEDLASVAPASELAPILKEASETMSPEGFGKLEEILKAAQAKIDTGALFAEIGSAARSEGAAATDAYGKIEKLADELVEKSTDLSRDAAIDRVLKTDEGKRLYSEYTSSALGIGGVS